MRSLVIMLALLAPSAPEITKRPILISVDDLPFVAGGLYAAPEERERITRGMLDALAKHKVKAIGFVTWSKVRGKEDLGLLEKWLAAGHELGNHSFGHLDYTTTAADAYIADVERGRKELDGFLRGRARVRFFRFPFLDEGDTEEKLDAMRAYLAKSGQRAVPVTIDDQDWSFEDRLDEAKRSAAPAARERLLEEYRVALRLAVRHHEKRGDRIMKRATPEILLLHAGAVGAEAWDALFSELEETHRFAPPDEVLADESIKTPSALVSDKGFGLWDRMLASSARERTKKELVELLNAQAKDWNKGDVDAFCAIYGDDATFISPSGLTQGRRAIADRYKKKYSTKEKMGTLSFDIVEVRLADGWEADILGNAVHSRIHGASVIMRWKLEYPDKEPASGLSLVTMRPAASGWRIVQDASM